MTEYQNLLSLRHDGKGVPYGGRGEPRADGEANHGFKDVKGNSDLLDSIPELSKDSPLKALVTSLNQPGCGLVTIGCEVGEIAETQGHRRTGYMEFAINSVDMVLDAKNYFTLYFHFDQSLASSQFSHRVQIVWELQPAHFLRKT